uniref:Uncharacterized protein n=1 Tax=Globodera rostochiensis TaxID=31243 RepID=A0A914HNF1_GLORO
MKSFNSFFLNAFLLIFLKLFDFGWNERLYREPPTTLKRYFRGQIWENNEAMDQYGIEVVGDDVEFQVLESELEWKDEKQFMLFLKLKHNTPVLQVDINQMVTGASVGYRTTKKTVHSFVVEAPNEGKSIDFTKYFALDLTEQKVFEFPTFSALKEELERRKNIPTPEQILATLKQALAELDARLSEKLRTETQKLLNGIDTVLHYAADQHVDNNQKFLSSLEQARNAMLNRAKLMTSEVGKQVKYGLLLAFGHVVFTFV